MTAGETVDINFGTVEANAAVTAAGGVTSSDTAAALNIVEAPVVSLRLGSVSVAEDASSPVAVTARLDRAADAEVVVNISAAGAAATLSDDKKLTVAAGDMSSTGTVTLTVVDDDVDNTAPRLVKVSGTTTTTAAVTGPADVALTVTDDDPTSVTLARAAGVSVSAGGTHIFTVTLGARSGCW